MTDRDLRTSSTLSLSSWPARVACLGLAGLGAMAMGIVSLGGCSLVLSFDECTSNADCDFGNGGTCENGKCVASVEIVKGPFYKRAT